MEKLEADAREELRAWEERRQREDLAEKRRKAPGWLDSGVHILKPENVVENVLESEGEPRGGQPQGVVNEGAGGALRSQEGDELDRVFGGLNMK